MPERSRPSPFRSLALLVVAALIAVPGAPVAAAATPTEVSFGDHVRLRTRKTATVVAGDRAWIMVSLRGQERVEDLRFTASLSDGGTVDYPANTVDHSGPSNGYTIDDKETDYVAFQLTVPSDVSARRVTLTIEATWTFDGEPYTAVSDVRVPVVQYEGNPYELLSDAVTLTDADDGWVALSMAGLAPRVDNVEISVTNPDLDVYYPRSTFTSLAGDSLLEDGETDIARFRLGEAHRGQTVDLEVQVRCDVGGVPAVSTHVVTVTS